MQLYTSLQQRLASPTALVPSEELKSREKRSKHLPSMHAPLLLKVSIAPSHE